MTVSAMDDKTNPELSMSSEEPRESKKNLWIWVVSGLLVVVLVPVLSLAVWFLFNIYQDKSAAIRVAKANVEMDDGNLSMAHRHAMEAYKLAPESPDVMRLLAQLLMTVPTEVDRAIYFFNKLRQDGEATRKDMVALVRCYLAVGKRSEAKDLVSELMREAPDDASITYLQADVAISLGKDKEAELLLGKAMGQAIDPHEQFNIASAMITQGYTKLREIASRKIEELAEREDQVGIQALEKLSAIAKTGQMENVRVLRLIERLRVHPEASDRHLLIAESLRIFLNPKDKKQIVKVAIRERVGKPIYELVDFLEWLSENGENGWVLDLVEEEIALGNANVLNVYLNALIAEGRWRNLQKLMNQRDLLIGEVAKQLMRAKIIMGTGKSRGEALSAVSLALSMAKNSRDMNAVVEVTRLAEELQAKDLLEASLHTLEGVTTRRELALESRYILAKNRQRLQDMREIVDEILALNPSNQKFAEIDIYFDLLLGSEIELVSLQVQNVMTKGSGNRPMQIFLRLFDAFRRADYEEAILMAPAIDPESLELGPRAILAAVLDLGGDSRKAVQITERIPEEMVLPQERRFLETAKATWSPMR